MAKRDTETLTDHQKRALPFIVKGPTIDEACKLAQISRETYYRWTRDSPAFVTVLEDQRDSAVTEALGQIKAAAGKAVAVLVGLLESDQETVRERAAARILDYVLNVKEVEDLQKRLEWIEKNIKGAVSEH